LTFHPAVLRVIRFVADAARDAGRPLSICGEMAGDPAYGEPEALACGRSPRYETVPRLGGAAALPTLKHLTH
jgi:hypothetical protein